jgi:ELWxxDGT repeat protein
LFDGTDASGQTTLWVTDGTLAGTSEIGGLNNAGVTGAARGGLLAQDIVADGNTAFFYAFDAAGIIGLWVTDGTAAGTNELTNIAGASSHLVSASPPVVATVPAAFAVDDLTTGVQSLSDGTPYIGPVSGLLDQYIYTGSDNLNVAAGVANTFIHTGSGEDAIDVSHVGGTNVLDGGSNSNFLVGGTGAGSFDTFFVDDRGPSTDIWSTVANFHGGDAATIFGITPNGFNTAWVDGQGAAGYTGLTLHVTAPGVPTASLTLSGYTTADLTNGTLTTSYGTENDGTPYLYVHEN